MRSLSLAVATWQHLEFAKWLQSKGEPVHGEASANLIGEQPIHRASEAGFVEIVQWLLDNGAEAEPTEGAAWELGVRSPLMMACIEGHVEVVTLLMGVSADVNAATHVGRESALHLAAEAGQLECAKLLQAAGAAVDKKTTSGDTPATKACERGHLEVVTWLKAQGAKIKGVTNKAGETCLHLASESGSVELVTWLLDEGLSVSAKTRQLGNSPLMCACAGGHVEVCRLLHARGGKIKGKESANKDGEQPIHQAARNGDPELLLWLLAHGAACDTPVSAQAMRQPIHFAVEGCGELEAVVVLADAGASLEVADRDGDRPAHYAASGNELAILKHLHAHGVSVDVGNKKMVRPMHLACANGNLEIVQWLHAEVGCALDAADKSGYLPMHYAAEECEFEIAKYLRSHGSTVDAKCKGGKTPLQLVETNGADAPPSQYLGKQVANWLRGEMGLPRRWDDDDDESEDEQVENSWLSRLQSRELSYVSLLQA